MGQFQLLLTQMITILSAQEQGDFVAGSGREPLNVQIKHPDTLGAGSGVGVGTGAWQLTP